MALPRILVIGKNGQVGWELRRTLAPLGHLICVDYPEIDLTEGSSIRQWINRSSPQIIVNAAAYTAVDKSEDETDLAMKINGIAPGILAEEAKAVGSLLVHYSTDYVFDGSKKQPYLESDPPNPLCAYGRSKWLGDQTMQQVDGDYLVFRLCWVYGARGQNFMLTMKRLAREREKLRVVSDQIGCPTWSRMIAEATALVLKQVQDAEGAQPLKGVYHLCAAGSTSWHGFAEAIIRRLPASDRRCQEIEPIPTAEYPTPAKRPAYSVMSCAKLERTFGIQLPHWEESLEHVMETS